MGISYPIISDHIRSHQIISQLRFNMFKLALLLVAFAAVHLAQGGKTWTGRCGGTVSKVPAGAQTKITCEGKVVGQVSCYNPCMQQDNEKSTVSCEPCPPMKWWPMG